MKRGSAPTLTLDNDLLSGRIVYIKAFHVFAALITSLIDHAIIPVQAGIPCSCCCSNSRVMALSITSQRNEIST